MVTAESQQQLLQAAIDQVVKGFADRLPILRTMVDRLRPTPCDPNPQLFVFFFVDEETERSSTCLALAKELDAAFRHTLLLSNYFRNSHETVETLVLSEASYNTPWFRR
jgi:hypothetical protein